MRNPAFPLIIIIAAALLAASCFSPAVPPVGGDDTVTNQMLNNVMSFIRDKHPDAAPFIRDDLSWGNVSSGDRRLGYSRSTYTANDWTVTLGHAITPEVIYEVRAEYKNDLIVWLGIIKDNIITEQSYVKK